MKNSHISWTDHTFNPWEGCTKVSPGCANCYAENRNARFGGGTAPNWGEWVPCVETFDHICVKVPAETPGPKEPALHEMTDGGHMARVGKAATRPLLLAEMRKQRGRERVDAPEKGKGYCYGEGTQRINGRSTLTPAALEQVRAYIADGSKRPTLFAAKAGIARATLIRHAKILRKAAQ